MRKNRVDKLQDNEKIFIAELIRARLIQELFSCEVTIYAGDDHDVKMSTSPAKTTTTRNTFLRFVLSQFPFRLQMTFFLRSTLSF
jgi:hypothetical protein